MEDVCEHLVWPCFVSLSRVGVGVRVRVRVGVRVGVGVGVAFPDEFHAFCGLESILHRVRNPVDHLGSPLGFRVREHPVRVRVAVGI